MANLICICQYSTIPVIRQHLPGRDIQQLRLCPQRQHRGVLQRQRQVRDNNPAIVNLNITEILNHLFTPKPA